MSTPISRSVPGFAGAAGVADLYKSATQSLIAQNPGIKTIDAQLSRDQARLSSIGKLALALDDFRKRADQLSGNKLDAVASVGGKAFTAALKNADTAAGTHTIEVKQLAQGQSLATRPLPGKDVALGIGAPTSIKIDAGSGSSATSTTVRIENGNNSLEGIAKAMRDAGLDAKVVQDGKGYSISLTGATGAANSMRISVAGDPALKALLAYGPDVNSTLTQKSPAQDAQVTVDGKALVSPSNQLDNAIPGLAIQLTASGKGDVKVGSDPDALLGKVKAFVSALNTLADKLGDQDSGDAAARTMAGQIRTQLDALVGGGNAAALADLGITRRNGKLALDDDKLKAGMAAAPDKLTQLFGKADTGLAAQLSARVSQMLGSQGVLAARAATVQGEVDKLNAQKAKAVDAAGRQASALVQQYAMAGTGGSSLFGPTGTRPLTLFDFI